MQEFEYVAGSAAAKAFEEAFVARHVEGRRFLVMEGAAGFPTFAAGRTQRDVLTDHIDNIGAPLDLFNRWIHAQSLHEYSQRVRGDNICYGLAVAGEPTLLLVTQMLTFCS